MKTPFTRKSILEKALCVLAIIENAHQKIKVCKWHIETKNVFYPQIYWEKQIEMHEMAIQRLEKSYQNLIQKSI